MFYLGINFVLARSDFLLSVSNNIGEKEKQFDRWSFYSS